MKQTHLPDYLTENDAAALIGLSGRTLQRYRQAGIGPVYSRVGLRKIRYQRSDVLAWAKTRRSDAA